MNVEDCGLIPCDDLASRSAASDSSGGAPSTMGTADAPPINEIQDTPPTIQADTTPTTGTTEGSGQTLGSETAPTEPGSGNIYDIGPGKGIPVQSEPGSVIRAIDINGQLHNIWLYDWQGNIVERIDVLGRPHFGIEPPHVEAYTWK